MNAISVLLAGTVGSGAQHHQADMWAPRLAAAGLFAEKVWTPPSVGDAAIARASRLAGDLGIRLEISEVADTSAAGAIVCLRGEERRAFLSVARDRGIPVLLDKPTLDSTEVIEGFADHAPPLLTGHHLSAHPGFTRALRAAHQAEIGLLRAVAAELVVADGDGPSPDGELRNLGAHVVELLRQATGPATVRLQAYAVGDAAWTFLGQTERDVVVNAHVSRTSSGAGEGILRAIVRFVGTHGSVRVDLTRPMLELRTPAPTSAVPFGDDSVVSLLRRFADIIGGRVRPVPANDLVLLSRALDAVAASAAAGAETTVTW